MSVQRCQMCRETRTLFLDGFQRTHRSHLTLCCDCAESVAEQAVERMTPEGVEALRDTCQDRLELLELVGREWEG